MKKTVSLILAVMMLLGCMSLTAFATDNNTTEITATVANTLTYKMVIPSAVSMTEAGVKEIGAPSVENVKFATDDTVISYKATGTQLTLVGGTATMATSYYTNSTGTTPMPSTAIEVYKSKALVDPLTTLYVSVAQEAWDAAENGTYKATVTFNFTSEEKAAAVTVASILPDDFGGWPGEGMGTMRKLDKELYVDGPQTAFMSLTEKLTPTEDGNYTASSDFEDTWTFIMNGSKCNKIIISNSSHSMVNGEYYAR